MQDVSRALKVLEYANDARKFEIGLFWQRSLVFWGFSTTAILAYGAAYQTQNRNLQFAAACVGLISGVIWRLVNKSSQYWQRVWDAKTEKAQFEAIGCDLFSGTSNDAQDIKEDWGWGPQHYSITRLAVAFTDYTIVVWLCLMLKSSPIWPFVSKYFGKDIPLIFTSATFVLTLAYIAAVLRFARYRHKVKSRCSKRE
jgi:hypothetical protein